MFLTSPVCQSNQLHEQWFKMASRKRKLSSTSQWHRKTFAKLLSSHEKLLCYFVAKPISAIWHECYIYRSKKVAWAFLKKRQNSGHFSVIFSHFDNTFCLMLRQLRCALLIQTRVSQFHASAQWTKVGILGRLDIYDVVMNVCCISFLKHVSIVNYIFII
jgi:hypothetical protein